MKGPFVETTPVPWKVADGPDRGIILTADDAEVEVCRVTADNTDWPVVEADAKLIVRAVNSHAALVAACEGLLDENDTEPHGECDCAQCVARAALAAAKETPDAGH